MVIDITRPIHPAMAPYPGNPAVTFERTQEASDTVNALSKITLGSHTGTHIDSPAHIHTNAAGAMSYPLDQMIGKTEVIEIPPPNPLLRKEGEHTFSPPYEGGDQEVVISASNLPPTSQPRVLIKTKNSSGDPNAFDPAFVALDETAAEEIVRRGVKLIGIDGPSIKKKGVRDRTHAILLDAGVVVLEGLWLANAAPAIYELICLPLPVDLDGAPVRAVLLSTA